MKAFTSASDGGKPVRSSVTLRNHSPLDAETDLTNFRLAISLLM